MAKETISQTLRSVGLRATADYEVETGPLYVTRTLKEQSVSLTDGVPLRIHGPNGGYLFTIDRDKHGNIKLECRAFGIDESHYLRLSFYDEKGFHDLSAMKVIETVASMDPDLLPNSPE